MIRSTPSDRPPRPPRRLRPPGGGGRDRLCAAGGYGLHGRAPDPGGPADAQDTYLLEGSPASPLAEVLNEFAKQHYQKVASTPRRVYLPLEIRRRRASRSYSPCGARARCGCSRPSAARSATWWPWRWRTPSTTSAPWSSGRARSAGEGRRRSWICSVRSGIRARPRRIEAFDISNIQGKAAVGSMIVFEDGHPKRSDYRRFRIQPGEAPNDYAMMHEVLSRRLTAVSGNVKFARLPDLMLVDGGQGSSTHGSGDGGARYASRAGLAKEHELVYLPEESHPVALPSHSPRALPAPAGPRQHMGFCFRPCFFFGRLLGSVSILQQKTPCSLLSKEVFDCNAHVATSVPEIVLYSAICQGIKTAVFYDFLKTRQFVQIQVGTQFRSIVPGGRSPGT